MIDLCSQAQDDGLLDRPGLAWLGHHPVPKDGFGKISDFEDFCDSNNQGFSIVFSELQKRSLGAKNSSKRSWNAIREVLRGRMESPALSPLSRAFPPERRTKWH